MLRKQRHKLKHKKTQEIITSTSDLQERSWSIRDGAQNRCRHFRHFVTCVCHTSHHMETCKSGYVGMLTHKWRFIGRQTAKENFWILQKLSMSNLFLWIYYNSSVTADAYWVLWRNLSSKWYQNIATNAARTK
jgi:hypothetical protein